MSFGLILGLILCLLPAFIAWRKGRTGLSLLVWSVMSVSLAFALGFVGMTVDDTWSSIGYGALILVVWSVLVFVVVEQEPGKGDLSERWEKRAEERAERMDEQLHAAAKEGDPAAVEALIAAGADPKSYLEDGTTPLHQAAAHSGDPAVVVALIAAAGDGDPNPKTKGGDTPLHLAAANDNLRLSRR